MNSIKVFVSQAFHFNYNRYYGSVYYCHLGGWWGTRVLCSLISILRGFAWRYHNAKPLSIIFSVSQEHECSANLKLFFNNVAGFKFKYWWLVIFAMLIHRLPFLLFAPSEAIYFKKGRHDYFLFNSDFCAS